MYHKVTGVTSDISVPSTYLFLFLSCMIEYRVIVMLSQFQLGCSFVNRSKPAQLICINADLMH